MTQREKEKKYTIYEITTAVKAVLTESNNLLGIKKFSSSDYQVIGVIALAEQRLRDEKENE
jgi:hypothetical protein